MKFKKILFALTFLFLLVTIIVPVDLIAGSVTLANLRLLLNNGIAFTDFSAANTLTPYSNYRLTLIDSSGKKAKGYIHYNSSDEDRVYTTYAASGSSGITVADNVNIQALTGNFTLRWKGALPDWTPAATTTLVNKALAGTDHAYLFRVDTNGTFILSLYRGALTNFISTSANTFTDGTVHEVVAVITRETAGTAGSVVFYTDGVQLGSPVAITAAATDNLNSTRTLYISGNNAVRTASTNSAFTFFNRALSAAEVLSLYQSGVATADQWGSQTELITTQTNRDFSGANNWANGNFNSFDNSGDLSITASAGGQWCHLPPAAVPMTTGIRYRLSFDVANPVSTFYLLDDNITHYLSDSTSPITFTAGRYTSEFTYLGTGGGIVFYAGSATSSGDFDNFSLTRVGATLDLEPSGIGATDWQDASSNNLDASYPAAGWSVYPLGNGALITSIRGGTTYNYNSIEAGFNEADASGYTYTLDLESRRNLSFGNWNWGF